MVPEKKINTQISQTSNLNPQDYLTKIKTIVDKKIKNIKLQFYPKFKIQNQKVLFSFTGEKIQTNIKLNSLVRLLYLYHKENEEYASRHYNFKESMAFYNFIRNNFIIFKDNRKKETQHSFEIDINRDTIFRYVRKIVKSGSNEEDNWEENNYIKYFHEAFKDFDNKRES